MISRKEGKLKGGTSSSDEFPSSEQLIPGGVKKWLPLTYIPQLPICMIPSVAQKFNGYS